MAIQKFKVFVHRDLSGVMADFLSVGNHAGARCFEEYIAIGPIDIEIDVPEFDARQAEMRALERQLGEEDSRHAERLREINYRAGKLMGDEASK